MSEERKELMRKATLAIGLTLLTIIGFRITGFATDPAQAATLRTSLDDAIPFVPHSVFAYSWVYSSMLYPLFVVRCPELFKRVALAYTIVIAVTLTFFALYPVTSLGFRPDASLLDDTQFHLWAVRLTFVVDPPMNLFPSLHLSIATLSALCAWKAHRGFGLLAGMIALGVAISICTMKQHYIADGLAALALTAVAYRVTLHTYDEASHPERSYSWRGPAAYLAFHGLFYVTFYVLFLCGWKAEG